MVHCFGLHTMISLAEYVARIHGMSNMHHIAFISVKFQQPLPVPVFRLIDIHLLILGIVYGIYPSAKMAMLFFIEDAKSLTYNKYRSGPSPEPGGTTLVICVHSDYSIYCYFNSSNCQQEAHHQVGLGATCAA